MVTWYWAAEYIKVLAGYGFLMFIWPAVVLRRFLNGRSTTFCFAFCVTFQPVLINTVVIVLGLFHLLNVWVIRGLFYIPFLIEVLKWLGWGRKEGRNIKHLLNGTYGLKLFVYNVLSGIRKRTKGIFQIIFRRCRSHWWEYGLLSVIIIYGMIYFSWGTFQTYSFGASDMYVHNAWIYGLVQGKIFSAGVYPEGMHCFIYGMYALFGIRIYSCLLFLQSAHVAVFLLAVHFFFRELFRWKYTSMFVVFAFLVFDVVQMNAVISMARLQWTLPQEFGFHTIFLCAAFLVRYLRSTKKATFRGKLTEGFWDENLLVFALSLAASLTIHFYPTIMAFFLCLAVVPVHIKKIFSKKRFMPLAAAVAIGVVVAVLPMAGALATGIPFQGSIGWAMNVIEGTSGKNTSQQDNSVQQSDTVNSQASQESGMPAESGQQVVIQEETVSSVDGEKGADAEEESRISVVERLKTLLHRILGFLADKWQALYTNGYVRLFHEDRTRLILLVSLLTVAFWGCYRILTGFLKLLLRKRKRKPIPGYFDQYLSVLLASFLFMVMYCGPSLGLPSLIESYRISAVEQILVLAVLGIPLDLLFSFLHLIVWKSVLKAASAVMVIAIYYFAVFTGNYHGFLCVSMTRLNGAVLCTQSITATMPPYSYTIISPTDELYQEIQYGWHEELSNFVNQVQEEKYTLPTEHLFIFIEKRPLRYAHYHFASGPKWLAEEKYVSYFGSSYVSQNPDYISAELLTEEELGNYKYTFELKSPTYSLLSVRTLVESLAYKWCQEFAVMYPGELQTYYEDENFVCYYIRQNPLSLYQLGLLYQEEFD